MAKKIARLSVVIAVISILLVLMTSCDNHSISATFDMDTKELSFNVPNNIVVPQENLSEYTRIEQGEQTSTIYVSLTWLNESLSQLPTIKNDLKALIPCYADFVDALSVSVNKEYFGTELFGTEYYTVNLDGVSDFSVPLTIVSNSAVMINGESSEIVNGKHYVSTVVSASSGSAQIELQQYVKNFSACTVEIDLTDTSPFVTYRVTPAAEIVGNLEYQMSAIGMTLESVQSNSVVFSEAFETHDDFQYTFSIRLFSMFQIVNTADVQISSFFSDSCKASFTFINDTGADFSVKIIGQEGSTYIVDNNGEKTESSGISAEIAINGNVTIDVGYSNVRWFATITSILMFIAVALVLFAMVIVARRKVGVYGNLLHK